MTTARGLLARTGLPQRESEVLLLSLLGRDRGWLFAHGDAPIAQHSEGAFMEWVQRRQKGEPLAYILGCLLYTSPSPRDVEESRMPSSA